MSMFENDLKCLWMLCKKPETLEFHNENIRSGLYCFPPCISGKRGAINRDGFNPFGIEQPENGISYNKSYPVKVLLQSIYTSKGFNQHSFFMCSHNTCICYCANKACCGLAYRCIHRTMLSELNKEILGLEKSTHADFFTVRDTSN